MTQEGKQLGERFTAAVDKAMRSIDEAMRAMIESKQYFIISARLTGPADSDDFIIFEIDNRKARRRAETWLDATFDDRLVDFSVNAGGTYTTNTMAERLLTARKIIPFD
jgi:hypothetical protein